MWGAQCSRNESTRCFVAFFFPQLHVWLQASRLFQILRFPRLNVKSGYSFWICLVDFSCAGLVKARGMPALPSLTHATLGVGQARVVCFGLKNSSPEKLRLQR